MYFLAFTDLCISINKTFPTQIQKMRLKSQRQGKEKLKHNKCEAQGVGKGRLG